MTENLSDLNTKIEKFGVFEKNGSSRRPIYIAGHSLGGAIGAILHGLWSADRDAPLVSWEKICSGVAARDEGFLSHSSYVYGAPRVCDADTLAVFRRNFSSRNLADPVPKMPPRFLGYCDLPDTITLDSTEPEIDGLSAFKIWFSYWRGYRELQNHFIDVYRKLLGELVGIHSPKELVPANMLEPISKRIR
jgi:hypothetical protein